MGDSASLCSTIGTLEDTVSKTKSPIINNSAVKFSLAVIASATVIYLTGYFFTKGALSAGGK